VCKIEKEIPKYSFFFFLSLGETRRMTPQITTGTFLLPWRRGYFFFFFHPHPTLQRRFFFWKTGQTA
jgi:hypothetical protein